MQQTPRLETDPRNVFTPPNASYETKPTHSSRCRSDIDGTHADKRPKRSARTYSVPIFDYSGEPAAQTVSFFLPKGCTKHACHRFLQPIYHDQLQRKTEPIPSRTSPMDRSAYTICTNTICHRCCLHSVPCCQPYCTRKKRPRKSTTCTNTREPPAPTRGNQTLAIHNHSARVSMPHHTCQTPTPTRGKLSPPKAKSPRRLALKQTHTPHFFRQDSPSFPSTARFSFLQVPPLFPFLFFSRLLFLLFFLKPLLLVV